MNRGVLAAVACGISVLVLLAVVFMANNMDNAYAPEDKPQAGIFEQWWGSHITTAPATTSPITTVPPAETITTTPESVPPSVEPTPVPETTAPDPTDDEYPASAPTTMVPDESTNGTVQPPVTTKPVATQAPGTSKPVQKPGETVPPTTKPAQAEPNQTVYPTTVPPTTVPATTVAPTTVPPTAVPPATVAPTTVPPTTVPPTTVPPTTVSAVPDVLLTYAEFMSLTPAEQQAYFLSFADYADYIAWYNQAKAEYDATKDDVTIEGGGSVDIGDIIGGGG